MILQNPWAQMLSFATHIDLDLDVNASFVVMDIIKIIKCDLCVIASAWTTDSSLPWELIIWLNFTLSHKSSNLI